VSVGFCKVEVKLFGPVQEYELAPVTVAVNESIPDEHKTLGVAFMVDVGDAFTVTLAVVLVLVPQPLVPDKV
jgi:hypothetical protein